MATKQKTTVLKNAEVTDAANAVNGYVNVMIDSKLCKQVEKNTKLVRSALLQQDMGALMLSKHLLALKNQFIEIGKKRKESTPLVIEAFKEYIQVQFDIGINRAEEYFGLIENNKNLKLRVDISKLIELNRLSDKELKTVLSEYPEKKLQDMTFRQVKEVVRLNNKNKRNRPKQEKNSSVTSATNRQPSDKSFLDQAATEEMTPLETIRTASEVVMEAIGDGKIPSDLAKEIDKLYKWKNEKQKKGKE